MDGFDWSSLMNQVVPALGGVLVGAFAIGLPLIGKLVKSTPNQVDDAIWKAVSRAFADINKNDTVAGDTVASDTNDGIARDARTRPWQ